MKTLILVHAHGGTEEILDRHMPFWKAHPNSDVVIACPEDLPIQERADCRVIRVGRQAHSGPVSIDRFVKTWQWALSDMDASGYDRIVVFEYDSLCLAPKFPYHPAFMFANIFVELKHSDPTYKSPLLAVAPWIMGLDVFRKVVTAIAAGDYADEGGNFDRYLMWRLINAQDIKWSNFGFYGYHCGFLATELKHAVTYGAVCLHGIKAKETLDSALEARKRIYNKWDIMARGSMRKLLLTVATDKIRDIAAPFMENHRAYAARNNYEYRVEEKTFSGEFFQDNHPSFSKVPYALEALREGFDVVIYADIDVAFIDQGVDLANLLIGTDYWFAAYWQKNFDRFKYLCCGLFVVLNNETSREFFKEWEHRCVHGSPNESTGITYHPWEQWTFSQLVRDTNYSGIRCCNAQEIGCFGGFWDDGCKWDRSCPTIHFAGQEQAMAEKSKMFLKGYAQFVC